jgi:uncharacterized protein YkwD
MGIRYRKAGENLAAGFHDARSAVTAWMDSPGHRANILNNEYTHMGAGRFVSPNSNDRYKTYWGQFFAAF